VVDLLGKINYILLLKMVELCFLGTGGPVETPERDNTSLLINYDENLILIDCAGSVFKKITSLGFDPGKISSIIVTHIHPDHVYGLPIFVHSLMLNEIQINLYGSEETVCFCRKLLDLFNLQKDKVKCRINFVALNPGEKFSMSPSLKVSSFKVPHNSSSLAFHFYFDAEDKEMIYSGDTPLYPPLFQESGDIDLLIHDCCAPERIFNNYPYVHTKHTNSLELGRYSQQSHVKCLIPCHFFGELGYSIVEVEKEIRINYKGNLIIPEDLMRISL